MFKNYFKSALRNMLRRKGYSFINIIGLSIGMACCLLILMFVNDELSFDKYNKNGQRIYRIAASYRYGGRDFSLATSSAPMAKTLVDEYPEVENAVRFKNNGSFIIRYGEKNFKERSILFCDSTLFDVFTIPLVNGDPKTALKEPYTLVISQKTAAKYFGEENPLGKIIKLGNNFDYRVTGIYDKIPDNSHFHCDIIASLASLEDSRDPSWVRDNFQTYILLNPAADFRAVEAKFPSLIKKYMAPQLEQAIGQSIEKLMESGDIKIQFYLQPLGDIHLYSDLTAELEPNSDIKYVYIFSAIALFILVIACINFMNLSTARSASRSMEVGIRKVLGSVRRQLISQFLTESLILSIISMFIALILANLALPYFNGLSGKELTIADNYNSVIVISTFVITLLTGLLAGFYPAFFISAFHPINVLKGRFKSGVKSGSLRSVLVVFQFAVSITLIIGTLVVMNQLNYIQNKKLGFDKDQVLILQNAMLLKNQAETFKNEMLKYPQIKNATISSFLPVPSSRSSYAVFPEGNLDDNYGTSVQIWSVDYDYIETLGMNILGGRNFSKNNSTDTSAIIVNQSAVKQFNWDNPLGKRLNILISNKGDKETYTVIGVVEDFHFDSLRNTISPLLLTLDPKGSSNDLISFRVNTRDMSGTISLLRDKWTQFLPGQPFEYSFLDDRFYQVYQTEQRLGKIFGIFALLAIFIGCLGLFGLAAFISEQKTKEIGIRKVLGASVSTIIGQLSGEFVILVGIANIIAWPTAYFIMSKWLQEFAFKTPLSIWTFLCSGLTAVIIALLTIGYQAIKAAVADPVKSIKYE